MAQAGSKSNPWIKDPNDVDNHSVTWTTWLNGDTLATSTWTLVSGTVAIVSDVFTTTVATVKVSGGVDGERALLLNRVTTAASRTKDRTVKLRLKAQ